MIKDGKKTIENAGQIVDADGDASLPTISVEAEGDGGADDQGPFADPVGCAKGAAFRKEGRPFGVP